MGLFLQTQLADDIFVFQIAFSLLTILIVCMLPGQARRVRQNPGTAERPSAAGASETGSTLKSGTQETLHLAKDLIGKEPVVRVLALGHQLERRVPADGVEGVKKLHGLQL